MTTTDNVHVLRAAAHHRKEIVSLLQAEKLPTQDLPATLDHFFVATNKNQVIGAIGLERYGESALLRSAVVDHRFRNKGVALQLVLAVETMAAQEGVRCMYLLTETAPGYFEKRGYEKITRDDVPPAVKASSEFSSVCPVSAVVMQKTIANP